MIKDLVIHLGDTKTGSTSIQKALVHNVVNAPGASVCYPTKTNHVSMARTLTQKRNFDQREKRFGRVAGVFKDSSADHGVVSAEHFQFVDPAVLQEAITAYWPEFHDRIRLIAYVRPHAEKLLSAFTERVKLGVSVTSLEDFFDSDAAVQTFQYAPRFEKWRATFGDRFELRPFIRGRMFQGDVVQDFVRYLLGHENFEITQSVAANTSVTVSQLALLREVHLTLNESIGGKRAPHKSEARGAVGRLLAEYLRLRNLGQDSDKMRLPKALAGRVKARYASDAAALDAAFFEGAPMSEALEGIDKITTDEEQSLDAADHFSPDAVETVRVFASVLRDLLRGRPEATREALGEARARLGLLD